MGVRPSFEPRHGKVRRGTHIDLKPGTPAGRRFGSQPRRTSRDATSTAAPSRAVSIRRVGARSPEPVDHPPWDCRTGAADSRSPRSVDALGWSRTSLVAAMRAMRAHCVDQAGAYSCGPDSSGTTVQLNVNDAGPPRPPVSPGRRFVEKTHGIGGQLRGEPDRDRRQDGQACTRAAVDHQRTTPVGNRGQRPSRPNQSGRECYKGKPIAFAWMPSATAYLRYEARHAAVVHRRGERRPGCRPGRGQGAWLWLGQHRAPAARPDPRSRRPGG